MECFLKKAVSFCFPRPSRLLARGNFRERVVHSLYYPKEKCGTACSLRVKFLVVIELATIYLLIYLSIYLLEILRSRDYLFVRVFSRRHFENREKPVNKLVNFTLVSGGH